MENLRGKTTTDTHHGGLHEAFEAEKIFDAVMDALTASEENERKLISAIEQGSWRIRPDDRQTIEAIQHSLGYEVSQSRDPDNLKEV